ncbi:MAG TPA: HAMP domain-containing sensor histidine kinase [Geminicoccus sp.]|uniref:sensor histidine kinase n=1 Tax=Geminicoccus sp. TaxID=2024832 RepID=UPI002BFC6039|nr:HAMP domain-containing sensor histidine kinase [Geminicoccus sp.]HWL67782.1 HAMP domain-containing sensor histidine kinase [Geminicoccus sp.]
MSGFSLRRRLALVMLFAFLLGLGGASLFYWIEVAEMRGELLRNALRLQAEVTLEAQAGARIAADALPPEWAVAYAQPDSLVHWSLYDAAGRQVGRSPNLLVTLPPPFGLPFGSMQRAHVDGRDIGFLAVPTADGGILQVARADLDSPGVVRVLSEEAVEFLFYTLLPFALLSMLAIWLVVGWSLRPLLRASQAAALVGPERLHSRIPAEGLPDEILPLVAAANDALDRLTAGYEAVRQLTADAAHELRTPLAALSLRLQQARLDGTADWVAIERETGHMRRLVQQMLTLARQEGREEGALATVNLARIGREVAASLLPLAEVAGRTIEVEAPDRVMALGDPDELRELVRNLVENGLAHGTGTVTVRVAGEGEGPLLEVADQGPGLPPGLGAAAFERYRKGDPASAGAGLGLAIVRRVVERHGGRIRLSPGPGCRVSVRLRPAGH